MGGKRNKIHQMEHGDNDDDKINMLLIAINAINKS